MAQIEISRRGWFAAAAAFVCGLLGWRSDRPKLTSKQRAELVDAVKRNWSHASPRATILGKFSTLPDHGRAVIREIDIIVPHGFPAPQIGHYAYALSVKGVWVLQAMEV